MRWMLAAALVLAPMAWAQAADEPGPNETANTLFAHAADGQENPFQGWMNTLADDPNATAAAAGGAIPQECLALGLSCQWDAFDFTWTFILEPPLGRDVFLDPAGNVTLIAHLGAESGSGADVQVSSTLSYGNATLAAGDMQNHSYGPSDAEPFANLTWVVPVTIADLAPGEALVWTIHATGAAGSAEEELMLGLGAERGSSRVVLPVQNSTARYAVVAEPVVDLSRATDRPVTASYSYNWTHGPDNATLTYNHTGNGTVTYLVVDGAGTQLANHTVTGTQHASLNLTGAAGAWKVSVLLQGFNGTTNASLAAPPPPTGNGTPTFPPGSPPTMRPGEQTTPPPGERPAEGNATQGDEGDGKGIPAPGLVALLLTFAAATWLHRRT